MYLKICIFSYKMPCMGLSPLTPFFSPFSFPAQLSVCFCCVFSALIALYFSPSIPQLPYAALSRLTEFQLQTLRCEADALTIRRSSSVEHVLTSHLRTRREITVLLRGEGVKRKFTGERRKSATQGKRQAPSLELLIGTIDSL